MLMLLLITSASPFIVVREASQHWAILFLLTVHLSHYRVDLFLFNICLHLFVLLSSSFANPCGSFDFLKFYPMVHTDIQKENQSCSGGTITTFWQVLCRILLRWNGSYRFCSILSYLQHWLMHVCIIMIPPPRQVLHYTYLLCRLLPTEWLVAMIVISKVKPERYLTSHSWRKKVAVNMDQSYVHFLRHMSNSVLFPRCWGPWDQDLH